MSCAIIAQGSYCTGWVWSSQSNTAGHGKLVVGKGGRGRAADPQVRVSSQKLSVEYLGTCLQQLSAGTEPSKSQGSAKYLRLGHGHTIESSAEQLLLNVFTCALCTGLSSPNYSNHLCSHQDVLYKYVP